MPLLQKRNVLIIKLGAIGDILLTTPSIRAYHKSFPNDNIYIITGMTNRQVLLNNDNIYEVKTIDDNVIYNGSWIEKIRESITLINLIKTIKPDIVFNMHRDWRFSLLLLLSGTTKRYGFKRDINGLLLTKSIGYTAHQHEIDKYINLLSIIPGFKADGKCIDIFPNYRDNKDCEAIFGENHIDRTFIGIVPGGALNSGMRMDSRRWPIEHFTLLVDLIVSNNMMVVLIGGNTDKQYSKYIIDSLGKDKKKMIIDAIGKLSIQGSYCVFKRCNIAVSSDCGPMHIASAAGIPVVSIFGPTDPIEKKPLSNNCSYVFYFDNELECVPCYKDGRYPVCTKQECMRLIKPEMVWKKIEEILITQQKQTL